MPLRKTDQIVFRASDLADPIACRTSSRLSAGLVAKRDLDRYYETLKRSLPLFPRNDALALLDALRGTLWESWNVTLLWADIADAEGLGAKWQIDQDALVARLRGLSYAECLATVDAAERFWLCAEDDTDAALAASGLIELEV